MEKRTTAELLEWLQQRDPQAKVEELRWGFSIIETTALDAPQVLITNSRAVREG